MHIIEAIEVKAGLPVLCGPSFSKRLAIGELLIFLNVGNGFTHIGGVFLSLELCYLTSTH